MSAQGETVLAEYMKQRQALTARVIELSNSPNWVGYTQALKDLTTEIVRIDNAVHNELYHDRHSA